MRNFIPIAIFVAVTVCAEYWWPAESAGISLEEARTQNEEIIAKIGVGVSDAKKAMKLIDEHFELIKEVNKLQDARIEKMLRETEGREEYKKAVEKYFSSSE